jgi:predicted MFS family arabinose efflux permease
MSKEFEVIKTQVIKSVSIYLLVVILAGFGLSAFIEGIRQHLAGYSTNGTLLYMTSFGSIITAIGVYLRGKRIIESSP